MTEKIACDACGRMRDAGHIVSVSEDGALEISARLCQICTSEVKDAVRRVIWERARS